jgi:hypothetical protein
MIRNITDVNWVYGVESKDSSNRLALLPVAEAQGIAGQVDNARLNFGVGKNHRNEKYQLFCVWVVFFKLIGCYKMAPRLIHNRPGAGALRECLVQVRYVAAADRPGKRRLWISRELKPADSYAQRLSFWLCQSLTSYFQTSTAWR